MSLDTTISPIHASGTKHDTSIGRYTCAVLPLSSSMPYPDLQRCEKQHCVGRNFYSVWIGRLTEVYWPRPNWCTCFLIQVLDE
jgi:hypothetical protein